MSHPLGAVIDSDPSLDVAGKYSLGLDAAKRNDMSTQSLPLVKKGMMLNEEDGGMSDSWRCSQIN